MKKMVVRAIALAAGVIGALIAVAVLPQLIVAFAIASAALRG